MIENTISVLFIEDDEDDYLLTQELLNQIEDGAYSLHWVATYEEGLDALRDGTFDVCLTDYQIGPHTGLDFVAACRARRVAVPLILLTGVADHDVDVAATQLGAADFLEKRELTPRLLERSIRYAIRHTETINALETAQDELEAAKSDLETAVEERTKELSEAKARLFDAVESISEGFALWDGDDRMVMCNDRYRNIFGDLRDALRIGVRYEDFLRVAIEREVLPLADDGVEAMVQRELSQHRSSVSAVEQELGDGRWLRVSKRKTPTGHIVGILTDISERKETEASIKRMALEDSLTKLPNRAFFQSRLEEALINAERIGRHVGLMLLDLDNFKNVNDTLGHPVGDELLQQVSRRLFNCARVTDTVARLGGDEFAVVATNIEAVDGVIVLAQRILQSLAKPYVVKGQEIHSGTSIGITVFPNDRGSPDELLRNADIALYRAKNAGRGGFQLYDESLNAEIQERRALEIDLRAALQRDEFRLVYQPQFDIGSGEVIGSEALLRWQHPTRGALSPADFISVAESTGLIIPISNWILETVCDQIRQWQDAGLPRLPVSVNMSPLQFKARDLADQFTEIIEKSGIDAEWLELEITEGIAMAAGGEALETLNRLSHFGVKLAIDDFWTGFSSLNRLKQFPIDRIKIDQSFVRDITEDIGDAAINTAVIRLGHSLNLMVIAEGVETSEQLAFLTEQGCDAAQGYLLCKPLQPGDFEAFLRRYDATQFPRPEQAPEISAVAEAERRSA